MSRHRNAAESSALKRLHRGLEAQATSPSASRAFTSLRAEQPALSPFASPAALIAEVADRDAPSLERNALFASLIAASRTTGAVGRLATTIVWLALWPGLASLFARERRWLHDDDELLSRITVHFAEHLARVESSRVTKLAVTLLLDTRRSLRAERERDEWADVELLDDCGEVPDVEADVDLSALHRDVRAVVGDDADLVLARAIGRTPFAEIASDAGVSEDAARKRIARAVDRLRHSHNAR